MSIEVSIVMGSENDLSVMKEAAEVCEAFEIPCEVQFVSAHRTAVWMAVYAEKAKERGIKVIIAGAGGSAHLPGMIASHTSLPVLAVPVKKPLHGNEALWSSIKMPKGVPLAVMPENGSYNAALFAISILSLGSEKIAAKYDNFKMEQTKGVIDSNILLQEIGWRKYAEREKGVSS